MVVRYLTDDDPVQSPIAEKTLKAGFLLTATVLMESEWVLRSFYRWPRQRIAKALADLMDLPSAIVVPEGAAWAIGRFARGADLADMIHIVSATGASAFATFDDHVVKRAGDASPLPVETLT